jgi:hypothetical protein
VSTLAPAHQNLCMAILKFDWQQTVDLGPVAPLQNASYVHRSLAMRMFVVWILGPLASMIIGGMIGAWLLRNGFLGMLAGTFTFVGLRLWFAASTDEPPR